MRERTPSADDTPKRAPPAPTREAASADVTGSGETPNDDLIVGYRTAKLSVSSASGTTLSDKMVASTQSLDDLGVNHPANASSGDHHQQQQQQQQQQLQERYGHACRSAQTAQDKRSRLSNVINNLRKKVPDGTAKSTTASESPRKEEDGRNSIERNLETLEKYVMTVLNRVIKDDDEEEDKNVAVGGKASKNIDKTKESDRSRRKRTDEEPTTVKSEHSDKDDIEAAVVPRLYFSAVNTDAVENVESSESTDCAEVETMTEKNVEETGVKIDQESKELPRRTEEGLLDVDENVSPTLDSRVSSRDASRERKENRSLGTIIMNRLSEHQVEERANVDDGRGDRRDEHVYSENVEMRAICRELLEDLLNDVYRTMNEDNDEPENRERSEEASIERRKEAAIELKAEEETKDTKAAQELSITSLHCSLPLDKVASVLQKCQTSEFVSRPSTSFSNSSSIAAQSSTQKSSSSSSSKSSSCASSIRLLCLYCDRKFLSISLRQRHTERVHQLGGGRRSERNPRKPSQNCQYCSEKCADTLEGLFQHMVGTHGDKYHVCVQCSTRYPTREALMGHMGETHSGIAERSNQMQPEKIKEGSPCKEFCGQNLHDKVNATSIRERKSEEKESESQNDDRTENERTKLIAPREPIDNNLASSEFDNSFYSNVSCNIRENLLNHLDGKLQTMSGSTSTSAPIITANTMMATTTTELKSQQQQQQQQQPQQSCYEHSVNQVQFPIDISLTAATPVYSKDYASEEYENSSEYARKAGKTSSGSRPRRISFEKYNFPRKYDGRGQWTCSIKDLSNFDISTQLLLRKKQQLIKERLTISRLQQTSVLSPSETTQVPLRDSDQIVELIIETATSDQKSIADGCMVDATPVPDVIRCDLCESPPSEIKQEATSEPSSQNPNGCTTNTTDFSVEFANFMRLRRREQSENEITDIKDIAHAELSGEWSRPRIYICGACGSRQVTLKEMEDHKASTHPHVLCSHFELAGDQREYYKHLYLPGRNAPTDEARNVVAPTETVCTKCTKNYQGVAELHRHMLECGGDHAWLLGLTSSGKKKCKWRPFGSRSRRRRQRGMKRNIQNSQSSPRVSTPRERQPPAGPRVRPSDRESIQKMLANLPPKRATRKILQDNAMRSQGRLRNVQTRTRPRIIGDNSSASRISRNKAALRNKLLKNAKSIQRNRCRSDNISAVIESVVKNYHENEKRYYNDSENTETGSNRGKDAKEINEVPSKINKTSDDKVVRSKIMGRFKNILDKTRNAKTKTGSIARLRLQGRRVDKLPNFKAKSKSMKSKNANALLTKTNASDKEVFFPKSTPKNMKMISRSADDDDTINADGKKALTVTYKNKLSQGVVKRKRPVDPVASLNASIKAKSQLRTQDGKFARNPNKTTDSSVKSLETKADDGKHNKTSDSIAIKSKLRTTQKSKKAEQQQPRRVTRLSSDSDKMPTLEPVVQISNEEYVDKSVNDLPILSPATSSTFLQEQKILRTVTKCILREKESDMETDTDLETAVEKVTKEQKQPRGRRSKEEAKDTAKRKEIEITGENETSTSKNMRILKEDRTKRRKNLPVKSTNTDEDKKEEMSKEDKIGKKDARTKKEEVTKETRSNSRARHEKDSSSLPDIPFEVKKLLGSASKEDLLSTLEFASNDCSLKRNLRQSTPRSRVLQTNDSQRGFDSSSSKGATKQEKIETIRKSVRKNDEKKGDKTRMVLDNDTVNKAIANAVNNIQLERADAHQSRRDGRTGVKASLINAKNMPSSEVGSNGLRKGSSLLGKRRNRNKSIDEMIDEISTRAAEEHTCGENNVSKENDKGAEEIVSKTDKIEIEVESDSNSYDRSYSAIINPNLIHLQLETSNSVDSGKENSLEISLNTHKLKVTRPRKIWGARRERASRKRSLSNVIGILTEGMNIPVEAQQSVVLTVQTSLDNDPDRLSRNGVVQQSTGEDNVVAVDSFSELTLAKNNESSENEVVTANATTSHHRPDNIEKNIHSDPGTTRNDENSFVNQEVDVSKIASAKAYSPTNDIILDLSRRKPKGKGSFLEKIVSKIVKQKDALLEGEMGTLLDTAADELTSILDEVGPAFTDNMENTNSDEMSQATRNDDSKGSTNMSADKKSLVITDSEIRSSKDDKTAVSECSADLLEARGDVGKSIVEKNERVQTPSENQIIDASDVETKDGDTVDRQVNNATCSIEKSRIKFRTNKSTTDGKTTIPMEISNEIPLPMTDDSTEVSNSLDRMQKTNSENITKDNDRKSERKFNKRSLDDADLSTKSKKRSVEGNEEPVDENVMQKELQLDDIIAFIHKSEETFSVENELPGKDDGIHKTLSVDVEMKTIQNSKNKIVQNLDSSLEKDLPECADRSNLEKSVDLSEVVCDITKKSYLKESTNGIISDEGAAVINIQPKKSFKEDTNSLELFSEKCKRSTDKRKNQSDTNESSSRYTLKRNLQPALGLANPLDVSTDILQTSSRSIDEAKEVPSSSHAAREQSLGSTDEQSIKVEVNEALIVRAEKCLSPTQVISDKHETQNTNNSSSSVNSTPSKITKKCERKKKSLADEHLDLPDDECTDIASNFNKTSNIENTSERLSSNLEQFKVPEVTDVLQSTKKRGPKRKSLPDVGRCNSGNVPEKACMNEEPTEIDKSSNFMDETEEQEVDKCTVEDESSTKKLERSNSSGSIGLVASAKTRVTSRRKQLSSTEDLVESVLQSQRAENTDDLSESSCASEFSYFRRKRFAKKKKKEMIVVVNAEVEPSITDLKRPRNEKRNAKRNASVKSLLDEHLDLSDADDIDVPTDIQTSLENTEALEDMERRLEHTEKSSSLQNESANETMATDDPTNNDSCSAVEQSNNHDPSDDTIVPKKRAVGNFVVAHAKNGEILIVEKKKKLTKEAPRFFCDVCETSFTRKSSLKKHTLSQSHLSQISKSSKIDKIESGSSSSMFQNTEESNGDWKNDQTNDQLTTDSPETSLRSITENSLKLNKNCVSYADDADSPNSLMEPPMTKQQQTLEDELLDEEICKITENMSHDEYVLTDHVTPEQPEASSTPIKPPVQQKGENSKRRKHGDKKRSKKRNLAEEHLILDSPELNRSRAESDELPNPVDDVVQFPVSSCEHGSVKEIINTTEETVDISEKTCAYANSVKTKNQIGSITETSDEKAECSNKSDAKTGEHGETIRTRRSTLRKLSKTFVENKEENQMVSSLDGDKSSNRFSLRLRSKKIPDYSDFDVDVCFDMDGSLDISMEINDNEIDDNSDTQKRQKEMEEGTNTEVLRKTVELRDKEDDNIASKISENAKIVTSKPEQIIDSKKIGKKRGRPKLKNRIISNPSVTLSNIESEINANNVTVTDNSEESKIDDRKSSSPIRDHSAESGKLTHLDTSTQVSKPKRGRPRKNVVNSAFVPTDNSNVSISIKLNDDEVKEKTKENTSHSENINEEIVSIDSINSLTSKIDSLTTIESCTQKLNSKTEKKNERSNIEEDIILLTDLNTSDERLEQKARVTNVKTSNTVLMKDTHVFNVPSEKNSVVNISYDAKHVSQNKDNIDETSINILINTRDEPPVELLSQITKETQKNAPQDPNAIDTESIISKTIDDDENVIRKLSDSSKSSEKIKSGQEFPEVQVCELSEKEPTLSSESEDSEDEASIIDNKSLSDINSHKSLSQQTFNNTIDIYDAKTNLLETPNKISKVSQSFNKEQEINRRKSKASKDRSTRTTMTKIAELSSDSENEDEIESAASSKNKIVKSVFGRVFGGEKVDKVKEVLNDWVSRSEDDSDISRSSSEARSCTRGSAKISENGHKNRHSDSDMRKDAESAKKKGSDKSDGTEIHGKSKNRKKRDKNHDPISKGHIESSLPMSSIKRKCRKSKIRASESIRRTFKEEAIILACVRNLAEVWKNNAREKSDNHPSCHKKRDADTRNERSSSPPQFSMFKCRRKESKNKIDERIWEDVDNDTSSCPSDDQNSGDAAKERDTVYESKNTDHHDNSRNIEQNDSDTWKNANLENQEQIEVSSAHGKSKKDSSNRKRQNFNAMRDSVSKMKTDEKIPKNLDNEQLSTPTRHQETKNESQEDLVKRCISESRNQMKNVTIDNNSDNEFFSYDDLVPSNYMYQDQDNSPAKLDQQLKASAIPRKDEQESPFPMSSIKRKCRKSKIRASESIRRTFKEEAIILACVRNLEKVWKNNAREKSDNHPSCHKKRDADTRNEHSSSPPQFSMFKCKRKENKNKIDERIWEDFDNDTSSCPSDDQNSRDATKERDTLYESKNTDHHDNSRNIEQNDSDTWKDANLENQKQIEASSARGKSKKDSSNRKRQNFTKDSVSRMKIDEKISKDLHNELSISTRHQETKNESQEDLIKRCTSESKNQMENVTIDSNSGHEFFPCGDSVASNYMHQDQNNSPTKLDQQPKASAIPRKDKQEYITEDWTLLSKTLDAFCQKDLAENNEPSEKDITQRKNEELMRSSRSCSSLTCEEPMIRDQSIDLNDQNSQPIRDSDDDNNEEEEEEDNDDNDLGRRRMSPFYARDTPDSSLESNSNNEEEDEEEEEEEEKRENNSKKTNLSEFSGEKVVIRSPSSGHRTDVVTIAPTDAIEDNALDVPREIKSTTEPRQGKILNFDEELFVECCSRLKATSENELRGTKKIKLDTEFYHRRDDQPQTFRVNRDRWRDVESQNSLGSLLESVNQLLGEEMYSGNEKSYKTRGSERSSRSVSPDASRTDNLGYEDSLDVAFEHNNKLRDKIQQRMRESENLLASTFGQKTNGDDQNRSDDCKRDNSYSNIQEASHLSVGTLNREQELGHKSKMNPTLGGLLDKALSNLLHNNGKHDHNGSAPMKLLAELACARAPTSTSLEDDTTSGKNHQSVKVMAAMAAAAAAAAAAAVAAKDSTLDSTPKKSMNDAVIISKNSPMKKTRNPIKELFERKKEINDRKDQERSKAAALVELNMQKQRKSKKNKKKQQQEFPLIRRNKHYGGLVEKKKRRDSFERKAESLSERIKDVYEFDEEESQIAPTLGSVMSYRSQTDKNYETSNWSKTKNVDKDVDSTLERDKTTYIADMKLDLTIERKFRELEKFAPKTKGALKSFQSEEQQQRIVDLISGPMDEFIERKQRLKRSSAEYSAKARLKKRGKSSKKRARNSWYENDSSDEFRTAAKASEDVGVGVGITKSQRMCSRGKQNLFAELSTSSESEYEQIDINYETANEQRSLKARKNLKKSFDIDNDANHNEQVIIESRFKNEDQIANNWRDQHTVEEDAIKKNHDITSESELSDHSLVIDERKTTDEARNSDDDADNQYERTFELDDLYREDSSDAETEVEENETVIPTIEEAKSTIETETLDKNARRVQTDIVFTKTKEDYTPENELIPLEEALNLLDQHEDLELKSENIHTEVAQRENAKIINNMLETIDATSNDEALNDEADKCLSPAEARDEKEEADDDIPALPEKLSSNEKPQKESDNLPLHVFLSRKVQESKKRKQQQLDKLREEQERILMDFQPTRRQRKCAIGKQGLLAEISSSDEESYMRDTGKRSCDKSEHDKARKKKESKEKRKERYIEKKHEQMIAKEQKAIEEEILREVKRKEILAQSADDASLNTENAIEIKIVPGQNHKKKHQTKEKQMKIDDEKETEGYVEHTSQFLLDSSENIHNKLEHAICTAENVVKNESHLSPVVKRKKCSKSPAKARKFSKAENATNTVSKQRGKQSSVEKSKNRATISSSNKDSKERKTSNGKRDSDDEELKTSKSWNKVEEGVGIAIGRRKRAAALQLYYWSSSSDEEPEPDPVAAPEEEEDDRQEQHGWIVGDSHKRMITMLAMEKQLKEKRRRSEDEFEPGKTKSKKHRNSTS